METPEPKPQLIELISHPIEQQIDSNNMSNTSPILEEDYSTSMDRSQENLSKEPTEAGNVQQPNIEKEYPILYVDINLGKDRVERLTVYEGEDPNSVSQEFAERTGINDRMKSKLEKMLKEQLASILSRINEEEDDEDGNS